MARTTKTDLRAAIESLQKQGYDIAIHWAYGQPRCTTKDEGTDLSPRLSMGEMKYWLHGFDCGVRQSKTTIQPGLEKAFSEQD